MRVNCMLLVLLLAGSAIVANAETYHYRVSDRGASAHYFVSDGCITTDVSVQFNEDAQGSGGKPSDVLRFVYPVVIQLNSCTGTSRVLQTYDPWDWTGTIQLAPDFRSAIMNIKIYLYDFEAWQSFQAAISMNWTVTNGPAERRIEHVHSPFMHANTRSLSRSATVIGSVVIEGVNLTPFAWGEASINQQLQGQITFLRRER